jgi:hypothetical protein
MPDLDAREGLRLEEPAEATPLQGQTPEEPPEAPAPLIADGPPAVSRKRLRSFTSIVLGVLFAVVAVIAAGYGAQKIHDYSQRGEATSPQDNLPANDATVKTAAGVVTPLADIPDIPAGDKASDDVGRKEAVASTVSPLADVPTIRAADKASDDVAGEEAATGPQSRRLALADSSLPRASLIPRSLYVPGTENREGSIHDRRIVRLRLLASVGAAAAGRQIHRILEVQLRRRSQRR